MFFTNTMFSALFWNGLAVWVSQLMDKVDNLESTSLILSRIFPHRLTSRGFETRREWRNVNLPKLNVVRNVIWITNHQQVILTTTNQQVSMLMSIIQIRYLYYAFYWYVSCNSVVAMGMTNCSLRSSDGNWKGQFL